MGQNFDDYPDFQKIPGMPILLQHSVGLDVLSNQSVLLTFCTSFPPSHQSMV